MTPFRIKMSAKDKVEADARIKDNEKRGFKLVFMRENPVSSRLYEYKTHGTTMKTKRKVVETENKTTYLILMEKESTKGKLEHTKEYKGVEKEMNDITYLREIKEDECNRYLENIGYNKHSYDGYFLAKEFYDFFNLAPKSIGSRLRGYNKKLIGNDFKTLDYEESKSFMRNISGRYDVTAINYKISVINSKGMVKLLYILGKLRDLNVVKNNINSEHTQGIAEAKEIDCEINIRKSESVTDIINRILISQNQIAEDIKLIVAMTQGIENQSHHSNLKLNNKQLNYTIDKFGNVTYQ